MNLTVKQSNAPFFLTYGGLSQRNTALWPVTPRALAHVHPRGDGAAGRQRAEAHNPGGACRARGSVGAQLLNPEEFTLFLHLGFPDCKLEIITGRAR